MLRNIFMVALGGALGTICRYLVSHWISGSFESNFPLATFVVNILGCLLIGIFYGLSDRFGIAGEMKLLLTVGFCGGLTTFSTFMNENLSLLRVDNALLAALYAGLSVMLGLLAVFAGKAAVSV